MYQNSLSHSKKDNFCRLSRAVFSNDLLLINIIYKNIDTHFKSNGTIKNCQFFHSQKNSLSVFIVWIGEGSMNLKE